MQDLLIKTATVVAVALATVSSLPHLAQKPDASAQQQTFAADLATDPSYRTKEGPALYDCANVVEGTAGKRSLKSGTVADHVVVKTREHFKAANGTSIPNGVGH